MHTSSCLDRVLTVAPATRLLRIASVTSVLCLATATTFAQTRPDDPNRRRGGEATAGERGDRGERGGRGNFDPQEMQTRMLNALRERLEVTDDEEWKLIADRIAKVTEARRNMPPAGGMFGGGPGRGGPPGGGGDNRGGGDRGSTRTGGNAEMTALSSAVRDKLPDAEIKSRLDRVREMRKNNEAKLAKAQADLRAVLSVRQEAVAVVFGLLP